MRISLLASALAFFLAVSPAVAGQMSIGAVVLNPADGNTYLTTCRNTRGYFVQRGKPKPSEAEQQVRAHFYNAPVKDVLNTMVPAGWKVVLSKHVTTTRPVSWSGNTAWIRALRQIAHANNLVVIVEWYHNQVFVGQL